MFKNHLANVLVLTAFVFTVYSSPIMRDVSSIAGISGNTNLAATVKTGDQALIINSPNGGTLVKGGTTAITWSMSSNFFGVNRGSFQIFLLDSANKQYVVIPTANLKGDTYTWYTGVVINNNSLITVPDGVYKIKVCVANTSSCGTSVSFNFTNNAPVVVTTSPTATLTMDGQTSRTYNVGDTVHYVWSSSNADTFSSRYSSTNCGSGTWTASTANGTSNAVVPSSSAGCVYTITYNAKNSKTGQSTSTSVVQTFNSSTVVVATTASTTSSTESGAITPTCSPAAGLSAVMPPDRTNNYNPAISSMTNYGRTFIDQTITGTDDCGNIIKVTASTALAGAIASIKVGNEEFISSGAHGAALQYALHAHYSDYGNHGQATEAYNPTEAGGYKDDIGVNTSTYPSFHGPSSSAIFSFGTENNIIKTSTRLAMWLKSGQRSGYNGDLAWYPTTGPLAYAYSMALSPYFLTKNISIGVDTAYGHLSNVIVSHDKVTIDPNESSNTFDATLIAYLLPQLSKHYTYDPSTKVLAPTTQDASVHAEFPLNTGKNLPIIAVSTLTGNAFAMYTPKLQNRNDTKAGYFLYNYNGVSNSLISASTGYPAFRAIQVNYAATNVGSSTTYKNDVMNYDTYFVVGNLDSVQRSISILDATLRTGIAIASSTATTTIASTTTTVVATTTATLTVDDQTSHTYNVGDTIHYAWNSSNADTFTSTYASSNCGSGTWTASTANGTSNVVVSNGSAGCVFTITYTAKNSLTGLATSTSVIVTINPIPSPTATLTMDDQTSRTYNVGDTVHYVWSSSNADTFSSRYSSTNCGSGTWTASTENGTSSAVVSSGALGCVYTITYTAKNSATGQSTSTSVVQTIGSSAVAVATTTSTTTASTTARCTDSSPEAPIYVIMGQSNAVGLGQIGQAASTIGELSRLNWPFKVWLNTNQTSWAEGISLQIADNFGPELGLAKAIAQSGEKDFYIFKYAVGATSFVNWYFTGTDGSYLYYYAIANLNTAKSQICDTGRKPVVRAAFWMQGESDAMSVSLTTNYISNLTGLVNGVRSNMMGGVTSPFVIGLIDSASGMWPYAAGVRNSQSYVASILSKVGVVETNDLPLYNAPCSGHNGAYCYAHYNSEGQLTLGKRFYDKYMSLR